MNGRSWGFNVSEDLNPHFRLSAYLRLTGVKRSLSRRKATTGRDAPSLSSALLTEIPFSNLQIAHIQAAESGGPRYTPTMTSEGRRAFRNLILLCHPHHTIVDKRRPQDFPVSTLEKWKAEREQGHEAALSQLSNVTQEGFRAYSRRCSRTVTRGFTRSPDG